MVRKIVSGIMSILLLLSLLSLLSHIQPVRAQGTIYIQADGSIYPSDAPISTVDDITYTLTGNITADTNGIVIERDNIVLNGAGCTVQGTWDSMSNGVDLSGRTNVTINNVQVENFTFGIYLYSSFHNNIRGNSITVNFGAGIYLRSSSSDNSISGNNIANNNFDGIDDESGNNNSINGNNITGSGLEGIGLYFSCFGDNINGNNITNNYNVGIRLYSPSYNNSISRNNIINNGINLDSSSYNNSISENTFIHAGLIVNVGSYQNSVENNTVNGKPLVYLEGVANYSVGDAGQIILVRCDSVMIENLTLSNVYASVQLLETNNSIISGNNVIANGARGIWLRYSSNNSISASNIVASDIWLESSSNNNSISGNNVTNNSVNGWGIYLGSSENSVSGNNVTAGNAGIIISSPDNSVSGNNVTNSACGIFLYSSSSDISGNNVAKNSVGIWLFTSSSSNNKIYHNNFINNEYQVSSSGLLNAWDDGYPSGGNYWSDYNGTDSFNGPHQNVTGSDGIGDTPYTIDANNTDNYPLIDPWSPPGFACGRAIVGQGSLLNLTVTNGNPGHYLGLLNVTFYANAAAIGNVTVTNPRARLITYVWNTTDCAYGNYTLSAYASPVPEETNTTDNNFTGCNVTITISGDLDGNFNVTLLDLLLLANAYRTTPASGGVPGALGAWNPNADINGDLKVDVRDLVTLANHYGRHYP